MTKRFSELKATVDKTERQEVRRVRERVKTIRLGGGGGLDRKVTGTTKEAVRGLGVKPKRA